MTITAVQPPGALRHVSSTTARSTGLRGEAARRRRGVDQRRLLRPRAGKCSTTSTATTPTGRREPLERLAVRTSSRPSATPASGSRWTPCATRTTSNSCGREGRAPWRRGDERRSLGPPGPLASGRGPWITEQEVDLVTDAVRTEWYEHGDDVSIDFEQLRGLRRAPTCGVALPSCTSAIHLGLAALGVTAGDEVIVPDVDLDRILRADHATSARRRSSPTSMPRPGASTPRSVGRCITERTRGGDRRRPLRRDAPTTTSSPRCARSRHRR